MITLCLLTTLYFGAVNEASDYVDLSFTCSPVSMTMLRHMTSECEAQSIDRCEVIVEHDPITLEYTYTIETKLSTGH